MKKNWQENSGGKRKGAAELDFGLLYVTCYGIRAMNDLRHKRFNQ